jgi:anti-anti-sigma factor
MNELVQIDFELRDGYAVTRVSGEIDISNVQILRDTLDENLDTTSIHVVDLTETTFIDSVTIRLLFTLIDRLAIRGQKLQLVVPADSYIRRLLTITDLDARASLYACLDDALADQS